MEDPELARCRGILGLGAAPTEDAIKKAYMQRSFAMIARSATEAEKESIKYARDLLLQEIGEAERRAAAGRRVTAKSKSAEIETEKLVAAVEREEAQARGRMDPVRSRFDPRSFESTIVNVVAPPFVAGIAILVAKSPFAFFLSGFNVWMHEFGHATMAWLTGHRALPLPIGWTNVSADRSKFVYFGILFLLGLLFAAGIKEKKIGPMFVAAALALAQYVMTWVWPEEIGYKWSVFGGLGGEFYLPALMVGLFYFRMPEKFRWGGCRYLLFFICIESFYVSYTFWRQVKYGQVPLPYGSMVNGEEDAGGDLNILSGDYGWRDREIIRIYDQLGHGCLIAMVVVYALFALRADRLVARLLPRR